MIWAILAAFLLCVAGLVVLIALFAAGYDLEELPHLPETHEPRPGFNIVHAPMETPNLSEMFPVLQEGEVVEVDVGEYLPKDDPRWTDVTLAQSTFNWERGVYNQDDDAS